MCDCVRVVHVQTRERKWTSSSLPLNILKGGCSPQRRTLVALITTISMPFANLLPLPFIYYGSILSLSLRCLCVERERAGAWVRAPMACMTRSGFTARAGDRVGTQSFRVGWAGA